MIREKRPTRIRPLVSSLPGHALFMALVPQGGESPWHSFNRPGVS